MNNDRNDRTEKLIREKIKDLQSAPPWRQNCKNPEHSKLFPANPLCGDCFADQIHAAYKEAGWKSPEELASFLASIAEETLVKARVGYVKLAKDQTLPETDTIEGWRIDGFKKGYQDCQRIMCSNGWRKVEEK